VKQQRKGGITPAIMRIYWRFPKIGIPPKKKSISDWDFPSGKNPFLGYPYEIWKPPYHYIYHLLRGCSYVNVCKMTNMINNMMIYMTGFNADL